MKLNDTEHKILKKCCAEFGMDIKAIEALFSAERDIYFANESNKAKVVPEMIKVLEFWAGESVRSSEK